MIEKDYSLLRAFNLEAAKRGEAICYHGIAQPFRFIDGPDASGNFVVDDAGLFQLYQRSDLRLAPLCWVEGKPVYKGDVLYTCDGVKLPAEGASRRGEILVSCGSNWNTDSLTWEQPKVKREGWVNIVKNDLKRNSVGQMEDRIVLNCDIFPTEEAARSLARACPSKPISVRIEWEEPAA